MNPDRHWPNLFKLKPSTSDHQWRQTTTSNEGSSSMEEEREREREREREKERNPDPKPRWNPKPEQIRILESIFNSGMVNPPREDIQKIRMQLQEYGEVGDANVFYWFQNRKSRTKQKQRTHQGEKSSKPSATHGQRCFDQYGPGVPLPNNNPSTFIGELSSSLLPPAASFPMQYLGYQQTEGINNTGHYINMGVAQMWNEGTCTGNINGMCSVPQSQQTFSSFAQAYPPFMEHLAPVETFKPHENFLSPSTNDNTLIHSGTESGVGSSNASLVTVFLNDIPVDVPVGRISVKTFFGPNAALYHSCGQPVLLDEEGFTLQALQQGAMYYMVYE